jgi:hypothetical protein
VPRWKASGKPWMMHCIRYCCASSSLQDTTCRTGAQIQNRGHVCMCERQDCRCAAIQSSAGHMCHCAAVCYAGGVLRSTLSSLSRRVCCAGCASKAQHQHASTCRGPFRRAPGSWGPAAAVRTCSSRRGSTDVLYSSKVRPSSWLMYVRFLPTRSCGPAQHSSQTVRSVCRDRWHSNTLHCCAV